MITKIEAAKISTNSGCKMFIANGRYLNPIKRMKEKKLYTCFSPKVSSLVARKKWIIGSVGSSGKLFIDQGAERALKNEKSLLAAGVSKVEGNFQKGANILILNDSGKELARGLSSFSSSEIEKIKGKHSNQIEKVLGYPSKSEIIHKDDMVKLK